jgi:hypothetical protein
VLQICAIIKEIMVIEKKIPISKNINEVWEVLGHEFAHPHKWASVVNHSEGKGTPLATTPCNERVCQTAMGNIREKLTQYSDTDFHLAYIVTEGMPGMIKTATNEWQLAKTDENNTQLSIKMNFIFQGLMGILMQPLMKSKLNSIATNLVEDFAYYVENGKPHPQKNQSTENMKQLKLYLKINYLFSAITGLTMLLLPNSLNKIFAIHNTFVFPTIGVNLLIFSAFVWFVSRKQLSNKTLVTIITGLDIIWVLGSLLIIMFGLFGLSNVGNILTAMVAIFIAFLAYKQLLHNK